MRTGGQLPYAGPPGPAQHSTRQAAETKFLVMATEPTPTGELAACEFFDPDTVIFLTGVSTPASREAGRDNLGLLCQPGNSTHLDVDRYPVFAADNGCYAEALGKPWDRAAWINWLAEEIAPLADRCLFATAPDVVGDAATTLERSAEWLDVIRELGLPAALVAQDGLEDLAIPWDTFDVLFIGGSTEWKLSPAAADLVIEARSRGKWIHMGRVNSWRRIELANGFGVDSVDGTFLGFGPLKNWPRLRGWLDELDALAGITATVELDEVAA